ncbi:MAG: hypothetical protein ACFFD7_07980 [Candidatus Thorarchaeota archaeon]
MKKSKLEIGSFLMLFFGMYTLIISILWIFLTEIMFVSDFAYYTGQTYALYLSNNPLFAEMYIITKKLIGFMLLGIGSIILFITKKSYSKGEKWSWFALLITGNITWGTFIGYKIMIGYIGASMVTFVVGISLLLIGLILPAKEILSKKSN